MNLSPSVFLQLLPITATVDSIGLWLGFLAGAHQFQAAFSLPHNLAAFEMVHIEKARLPC